MELDRLVSERAFRNRSQSIEKAAREKLQRIKHGRLAKECAKIEPESEKAIAEEDLNEIID